MIKGLPRVAQDAEFVSIDIEMFKMKRPHRADGVFACMSVAYSEDEVYLITDEADIPKVLEKIQDGIWVFQNALFDLRVLRRYTDVPQRFVWDTMLIEQDLYGGWYSRFSLDNLARRWLGIKLDKAVRKQFDKAIELTEEMMEYAAEDAVVTVQIAQKQSEYIYKEYDGIMPWYNDIDELAIWAILDMKPIRVDTEAWVKNAEDFHADAMQQQDELGFNVNSHKIVKTRIEALLGKSIKDTNANSTLIPLLAKINVDHPAAILTRQVIDIRKLRKMAETYGESWLVDVEDDGYVYPSWRVTGALTGRMSCADPNIQNVPQRERPIYRTFFPASPDHIMQVSDVSQQEPWFSAFLSGDQVLLKELRSGIDQHQVTGDLFGVNRTDGKAINLGLNYGMSEYGLAARVGISVNDARAGILARKRRYRQMTAWQGTMKNEARRQYKVHTVTGRPVWVNPYGEQWDRNAINSPVQGSAADHTKLALVKMHKKCKQAEIPFCVTMVVHDEICQDVPKNLRVIYANLLRHSWEEASAELAPGMDMKTEVIEGETWGAK